MPAPPWLDTPAVHGYVLGRTVVTLADRCKAAARYAALAAAGKSVKLWDQALAHQNFLGNTAFVERMQTLIERETATAKDIPRPQRCAPAKPIDLHLKRGKSRDIGIQAVVDGQHSMTDIAKVLDLSVSRGS